MKHLLHPLPVIVAAVHLMLQATLRGISAKSTVEKERISNNTSVNIYPSD